MEVPVGEELIGRVVNPLGQPMDGLGPIHAKKTRPIENRHQGSWIGKVFMNHCKRESKRLMLSFRLAVDSGS